VANPIGQIWSAAIMLDFLGHADAARDVVSAIERLLADPAAPRTRDIGGKAGTVEVGKAIAALI
jgi:tartrate dehydrogenase/decarboxylase/D-malate dehydrogenase